MITLLEYALGSLPVPTLIGVGYRYFARIISAANSAALKQLCSR
jgi:hypothetical protein